MVSATLQEPRAFTQVERDLANEAVERFATWLDDTQWRFEAAHAEKGVIFQLVLDRGATMAVTLGLSRSDYLTACAQLFDHQQHQQGRIK